MRNLPAIKAVHYDCKCGQRTDCLELKKWLAQANSEDLHALYSGEIENNTPYKFHDLLFNLHYKNKSARYYREEILNNFRELIAGTMSVETIKEQSAALNSVLTIKDSPKNFLE